MATQDRFLSAHFTLSELTASQAAARAGITNTPTPSALVNLERVRVALRDTPIVVSSGYRSPMVNALVGGALNSAQKRGLAVDFTCPGFGPPKAVCQALIEADVAFDQLIHEGTWVHLGMADVGNHPRRQVMTAVFTKNQPVRYLTGLL